VPLRPIEITRFVLEPSVASSTISAVEAPVCWGAYQTESVQLLPGATAVQQVVAPTK
jgi:hypothetical protein